MQTTEASSGQDPGNADETANGQAPDAHEQSQAAPSADVSALRAELDKYKAEAQRARDEAAARRVKAREESEAKARALKEQGEFKALAENHAATIEELKAQVSELEALRDKAAAFDSWQASELEAIEGAKKGLPAEVAEALDAAESLGAKKKILAAFTKTQGPSARVSQSAGSGSAHATRTPDFNGLRGPALTNAIKENPSAFWGQNQAGQKGSALGRMFAPKG